MQWIEVSVPAESGEIDDLCETLAALGAGGMVVEDERDFQNFLETNHQYWDYVDEALENQFKGVSRVKFYLSDDEDGRALLDSIRSSLGRELTTATVQDSDWENNWRQYYEPIEVGEKLVVVPEWLEAPEDGRVPLRLDPGLIFGTGSHATTKMCLAALERCAGPGKTVFDLGCGSGILAIGALADVINNDPRTNKKLKMVFIEDYRVSNAEMIFAASDLSEQISTASKEASGTGNMKFMLNGAVTIGTMDGANVEIVEEVGEDNAFIFGMSAQEVIDRERYGDYDPTEIFRNDPDIRRVLMQLVNGFYSPDDPDLFRPIYDSLLTNRISGKADPFFTLKDFRSYAQAQERVDRAYRDRNAWAAMAIRNIACSGKFSSDRTIQEYVDDIWHLEKIR